MIKVSFQSATKAMTNPVINVDVT
uniref:Uncharacterized protein n=1 Tax=Arundo donax TaxID=35708 RepID=A0A0A8YKP7_ARUDO